jgi:predicted nucleic acid-binding protein
MRLLLDIGVLARACHPSRYRDVQAWLLAIASGRPPAHELLVSPISFYELRRALARRGARESLEMLTRLSQHMIAAPVTLEAVEQAAALAEREPGLQAADADLLLVAQAKLGGAVWVRADAKMGELGAMCGVEVREWATIAVDIATPSEM